MIVDEEVFAVILAVVVVVSVLGIALSIPRNPEPFTAIGLLDQNCRIGNYPREVPVGYPIELCVFISNNLGRPALLQARIKISYNGSIPTNTTPLAMDGVLNITVFLPHEGNTTRKFSVTLPEAGERIVIAGELWEMDLDSGKWLYTGRYVFIRVNATGTPG